MELQKTVNDDNELLQLIKQDDLEALNQLYEKYAVRIYNLAFTVLSDRKLAEPIVIELFIHLWSKRHVLETESYSLDKYLFNFTCERILKVIYAKEQSKLLVFSRYFAKITNKLHFTSSKKKDLLHS